MYGAARSPAVAVSTLFFLLFSCQGGGGKGQHLVLFDSMFNVSNTQDQYVRIMQADALLVIYLLEVVRTARKRYSYDG